MPRARWYLILCLGLLPLACSGPRPTPPVYPEPLISADAAQVTAGDRLRLAWNHRALDVGLAGVTAPSPDTTEGVRATAALRALVKGEPLLFSIPYGPGSPSGGVRVYLYRASDQLFVNHAMLERGYASVSDGAPFAYADIFRRAEAQARRRRAGLWRIQPSSGWLAPAVQITSVLISAAVLGLGILTYRRRSRRLRLFLRWQPDLGVVEIHVLNTGGAPVVVDWPPCLMPADQKPPPADEDGVPESLAKDEEGCWPVPVTRWRENRDPNGSVRELRVRGYCREHGGVWHASRPLTLPPV